MYQQFIVPILCFIVRKFFVYFQRKKAISISFVLLFHSLLSLVLYIVRNT